MTKIRVSEIRVSKIIVSEIRVSEIKVSEIRVSEIRVSEIRVSEISVSEIRISSNHRELHGAIFLSVVTSSEMHTNLPQRIPDNCLALRDRVPDFSFCRTPNDTVPSRTKGVWVSAHRIRLPTEED